MKGKVALITGGSAGIGKATAKLFAERGARVVVSDIDVEKGEETVKEIKNSGGEAVFVKCDVSKKSEVENLIKQVIDEYGKLNYAFNNAGIEGENAVTAECSEENWDRTININLKGVWLCMKYEIPEMLKEEQSAIVNCSSVAGLVGFAGLPAYTASKHGMAGLTKAAALEYATEGIRINAISPGIIQTAMIDRVTEGDPETLEQYKQLEPVGRLGKSEEVAAAAIWLCSEEASFVTGNVMPVDGGYVAR